MKQRAESEIPDLFTKSDTTTRVQPLIDSPLVDETRELLSGRAMALGNLLASERAVEYVACLRAFVAFRNSHEPEPLHEDLEEKVCGEDASPAARAAFKADVRQLKEWGLIEERIEKERLRGYRDSRRTKFRYRLCDDAAAFVEWLNERREYDLNPSGGDETGNLLDIQRSLLAEIRRMLRKASPDCVDYDTAGDILFRVDRMARNVAATAKTLQELNLRLLSFGMAEFGIEEAKPIVQELGLFLERFGRRFNAMREDILRDIVELRRDCHAARWCACAKRLEEEASRFRHIASVKIPDAALLLADAEDFYGAGGKLVGLMAHVGESARKVWGRLNAKLHELERRNHRLEDLGARLAELARLDEDEVPHEWMQRLIEAAGMRGDAQIRPSGEKSSPPKPKTSSNATTVRTPDWIVPPKVSGTANVRSIAEVRAEELKAWMASRGIYPNAAVAVQLSSGEYKEFADFACIMQVILQTRLADGEKGRKLLGIEGKWTDNVASVRIGYAAMTFDDIVISCGPTVILATR